MLEVLKERVNLVAVRAHRRLDRMRNIQQQKGVQNIKYMSSKPHKIFGPYSSRVGGLQPVTGRNAQFPTMSRKQEYAEMAVTERPYISPFSGYTSSSETNLSISQAMDFNPELTRKLVREELEKQIREEPIRNDVGILKTEIRSIKEFLEIFRGRMDRDNEEDRQTLHNELKAEMDQLLEEHRVQTTRNLREVVKKLNEDIKKDLFKDCSSKYLPVSFIEDMDKPLSDLEDRMQMLETKLSGNRSRPSEDPVVIAETYELRLKKIEREAEYLKKTIGQTQAFLEKQDAQIQQLKSKQQTNFQKISYLTDDFLKMKQQNQKETKKIFHTIEENNKLINSIWDEKLKQISQQLNKKLSSASSNQVREFLNSSNNLTVSGMFENQNNPSIESAEKNSSLIARPLFESPSKYPPEQRQRPDSSTSGKEKGAETPPSVNKSPQMDRNNSNNSLSQQKDNEKQSQRMIYLIDKENFLLDADGNYITNGEGAQIQLTGEQIDIIRKSNIVKMMQ